MRDITNPKEIEQYKEELTSERLKQQKQSKDYDVNEDGEIETCSTCGTPLNSHSHCPKCDY